MFQSSLASLPGKHRTEPTIFQLNQLIFLPWSVEETWRKRENRWSLVSMKWIVPCTPPSAPPPIPSPISIPTPWINKNSPFKPVNATHLYASFFLFPFSYVQIIILINQLIIYYARNLHCFLLIIWLINYYSFQAKQYQISFLHFRVIQFPINLLLY